MQDCIYKILTQAEWERSQTEPHVTLPASDADFIHFSDAQQVARIVAKYYKDHPEVVILTIQPQELPGRLVKESNPGGTEKYWHLYEGSIPKKAIIQARVVSTTNFAL